MSILTLVFGVITTAISNHSKHSSIHRTSAFIPPPFRGKFILHSSTQRQTTRSQHCSGSSSSSSYRSSTSTFTTTHYSNNSNNNSNNNKPRQQQQQQQQQHSTGMFVDIGANLLDGMYQGCYRGNQRHDQDLDTVLQRAWDNQLDQIIVTAGTVEESVQALTLTHSDDRLYCTAGVHPTRCSQVFGTTEDSWKESLDQLRRVIQQGLQEHKVVALGELGLDYARLEFCDAETQKKGLIAQLKLARDHSFHLPLFLHNRDSGHDLLQILKEHYFISNNHDDDDDNDNKETVPAGGVVHSFDDSLEMAHKFMDLGLYIGINGCSLKTKENLDVVRDIPLDRIMLETDCPWCDIRPTHAGWEYVQTKFDVKTEKKYQKDCCVKGRNEPCHIVQVAEVIAGVKGVSVEEVARVSRKNAHCLFFGTRYYSLKLSM